ncbi:TPA: hypothetical protein ACRXSJ_000746 [Pseudomonas aeruginosa]
MISARVISIALACLLLSIDNRLGGLRLALLGLISQAGDGCVLLAYQGLQVATGRATGRQALGGLVELRPVVPRAEPETAGGTEADQQQAGQRFAAAQRLQQERAEGDQCAAAEAVIDKELGL